MSALATISPHDPAGGAGTDRTGHPGGKLVRLPAAHEQRILTVRFRSPDGRSWEAIGGGATVVAAIGFARESCPAGTAWDVVGWDDLYGE